MLLTEALQQIKILTERISKKRQFISKYVTYNSLYVDPLAKQGGSSKAILSAFQSLKALEDNFLATKIAIQKINLTSTLTVEGITRTVAEWVFWRRSLADGISFFNTQLSDTIRKARIQLEADQNKNLRPSSTEGQQIKEANIVVNLDELVLAKDTEKVSIILGTLDSRLSIFNATTQIDLDLVEVA